MKNKEQKLKFLRDSFWADFQKTGSIYAYGRYKGTEQLIKEMNNQKISAADQELEM